VRQPLARRRLEGVESVAMQTIHEPAAPTHGARRAAARRLFRIGLAAALGAAAAGCGLDAPPPAEGAAAMEPKAPEPPAPETTWVRLAALGSDAPHVRRKSFTAPGNGFRVIIELREPSTRLATGRVIANILSPRTTLPIRTLETRLPAQLEMRADTTFVKAEPGEYTLFIVHDYGVRQWSVIAEAPQVSEEVP